MSMQYIKNVLMCLCFLAQNKLEKSFGKIKYAIENFKQFTKF